MEEKELFEEYEMRGWELTPRIYKILGIATIANILLLYTFGQINFFTTRGCDTPYVGMVCQVLDSAYVASVFMGKGFESERIDYDPTEIADADITYIDVSEKLEYPDGYFALANPEQTAENSFSTMDTGIPTTIDPNSPITTTPSTGSDLMAKAQVTPTPNKSLENQESVNSPYVIGNNPSTRIKTPRITPRSTPKPKLSNDSPTTLPGSNNIAGTPKKTPQPTPEPTPTDAEAQQAKENFKVNKEPFKKLADGVIAQQDVTDPTKKVDLKQAFKVVLDGTLTKEGKFDADKSGFKESNGNQQMVDVAKSAIEAIGDSTILSYLQALGVDKVNITLIQDDKQITAIIKSGQPTEEKARTVSSGFNGFITLAKMNTKDDEEVQALLKGVKVSAEGKSFVINFVMPKDQAHQLIDKKLQEARQNQKKSQPNSGESEKEANAKGE